MIFDLHGKAVNVGDQVAFASCERSRAPRLRVGTITKIAIGKRGNVYISLDLVGRRKTTQVDSRLVPQKVLVLK